MLDILVKQVKRKCNITWEDEETTSRLNDIINSAIPDLAHKLGVDEKFDFSVAGKENTLFLAYCFYEWNNALNEFDDNYAKEIAQVRDKHAVKLYLASEESANE